MGMASFKQNSEDWPLLTHNLPGAEIGGMCPKRLEERTRPEGSEARRGRQRATQALETLASGAQLARAEAEHQTDSFSAQGRRGLTRFAPPRRPL